MKVCVTVMCNDNNITLHLLGTAVVVYHLKLS